MLKREDPLVDDTRDYIEIAMGCLASALRPRNAGIAGLCDSVLGLAELVVRR